MRGTLGNTGKGSSSRDAEPGPLDAEATAAADAPGSARDANVARQAASNNGAAASRVLCRSIMKLELGDLAIS
jgi:hypothetical protein